MADEEQIKEKSRMEYPEKGSDPLNLTLNYWEKPFEGAHSDIGYSYSDGGNLDALAWMFAVGNDKGNLFSREDLMDFIAEHDVKMSEEFHDSRYPMIDRVPGTSWGRSKRVIFPGNLEKP